MCEWCGEESEYGLRVCPGCQSRLCRRCVRESVCYSPVGMRGSCEEPYRLTSLHDAAATALLCGSLRPHVESNAELVRMANEVLNAIVVVCSGFLGCDHACDVDMCIEKLVKQNRGLCKASSESALYRLGRALLRGASARRHAVLTIFGELFVDRRGTLQAMETYLNTMSLCTVTTQHPGACATTDGFF